MDWVDSEVKLKFPRRISEVPSSGKAVSWMLGALSHLLCHWVRVWGKRNSRRKEQPRWLCSLVRATFLSENWDLNHQPSFRFPITYLNQ